MPAPNVRDVKSILSNALAGARGLEPWPHYFESKAREFRLVSDLLSIDKESSVLEIGCGNGFTSSLLAGISGNVVAFDLPRKDPANHSIGINAAKSLIESLNIENVRVVGGSVNDLPFGDESFDMVFSEYMLQYVPDKDRAIREMSRVLKPEGVIFTILPNFVTRLYAPIMQYRYLFTRMAYHLARRFRKSSTKDGPEELASVIDKDRNVKKILADHLMLYPDGAYKSFREELMAHMPWAWKGLFRRNGLEVTGTFSTEVFPLALFDIMGKTAVNYVSEHSFDMNRALGRLPIIRECGYSIGIIAKKARA